MSEENNQFDPLEFVPIHGTSHTIAEMKGTTLIIPMNSAGMGPMIATDLYVLNEAGTTKLGYLKSDYISPVVFNDS